MECYLLEIVPAEVSGPEVCSFFLKRDDYHVLLELKPYYHETEQNHVLSVQFTTLSCCTQVPVLS